MNWWTVNSADCWICHSNFMHIMHCLLFRRKSSAVDHSHVARRIVETKSSPWWPCVAYYATKCLWCISVTISSCFLVNFHSTFLVTCLLNGVSSDQVDFGAMTFLGGIWVIRLWLVRILRLCGLGIGGGLEWPVISCQEGLGLVWSHEGGKSSQRVAHHISR